MLMACLIQFDGALRLESESETRIPNMDQVSSSVVHFLSQLRYDREPSCNAIADGPIHKFSKG
jgi:hypothetical protein